MNRKAVIAVCAAAGGVAAALVLIAMRRGAKAEREAYVYYDEALRKAMEKFSPYQEETNGTETAASGSGKPSYERPEHHGPEYADYAALYSEGAKAESADESSIWDRYEHEPVPDQEEEPAKGEELPEKRRVHPTVQRSSINPQLRIAMPALALDPERVRKPLDEAAPGHTFPISEDSFKYENGYNDKVSGTWFHEDAVLAGWDCELDQVEDIEMARRCWTAVEKDPSVKAVYLRDAERGVDYEIVVSNQCWVDAWVEAHLEEATS